MKTKKATKKFLNSKRKVTKDRKITKKVTRDRNVTKSNHKQELKELEEKDPGFYNYLQENDQELLNFSDSSSDDDMEQEEEIEEEMDQVEEVKQIEEIRNLYSKIIEQKDFKSIQKLVKAFKSAANMGEEEECLDWDGEVVDEIVAKTLDLNLVLESIFEKEGREGKKWKKFSPLIKSILTNLLKLMKNTTDSKVLVEIIKKSSGFLSYYSSFPKLLKEFSKSLLGLWGMGDERVRVAAFLVMRRACLTYPQGFLDRVFKGCLKVINQVSKLNATLMTKLKFMNSCLVELSGLSLSNTYSFGFLGIRELALNLKNATANSDYSVILSWSFVNSIRLWADIIATYGNSPNGGENLKHLVYPLVQISIGALRLCPNSKNFPTHLLILQTLLHTSEKTGVFIPISSYLMEILSSSEITSKAKPSTLKPLDLFGVLSVPSGYMSTSVYQRGLFESVLSLFYDYFAIPSISFPELCVPITVFLKRWMKKSKNPFMSKNVRVLLEKIQEQSSWTEKERSRLSISPTDFKAAVNILLY